MNEQILMERKAGIYRNQGTAVIVASNDDQVQRIMLMLDYDSLNNKFPDMVVLKLSPLKEAIISNVFHKGDWLDWVIIEGGDEPMHPDWVRSIRDQCVESEIPFYFAGWGEWLPFSHVKYGTFPTNPFPSCRDAVPVKNIYGEGFCRVGKANAGRLLDGRTWDQVPE